MPGLFQLTKTGYMVKHPTCSHEHIYEKLILSTHQETIPARKLTDVHAQDFVTNDKLLVPFVKGIHTVYSLTTHCSISFVLSHCVLV